MHMENNDHLIILNYMKINRCAQAKMFFLSIDIILT